MVNFKINIVYYCYLMVKDWTIFYEQIEMLVNTELYIMSDNIYISASIEKNREDEFLNHIKKYKKLKIYKIYNENLYEYPGIKCLQETATDDSISLYFHTKGIGNPNPNSSKIRKILTDKLIIDHKIIIEIFNNNDVDKICCFKSIGSFCWFNFFWVRGNFLINKDVEIVNNRWYYERWSQGEKTKAIIIDKELKGNEIYKYLK